MKKQGISLSQYIFYKRTNEIKPNVQNSKSTSINKQPVKQGIIGKPLTDRGTSKSTMQKLKALKNIADPILKNSKSTDIKGKSQTLDEIKQIVDQPENQKNDLKLKSAMQKLKSVKSLASPLTKDLKQVDNKRKNQSIEEIQSNIQTPENQFDDSHKTSVFSNQGVIKLQNIRNSIDEQDNQVKQKHIRVYARFRPVNDAENELTAKGNG